MKLTFSDLISYGQDGTNDTSTTIKTFLKRRINDKYELVADKLNTFTQTLCRTPPTVAGRQYYDNPPNLRDIESVTITIDDVIYPLKAVNSQEKWNRLNAITSVGSIPEKFFKRRDDYGLFPIPQDANNTITIAYTQRAIPLYFEDYITGTVTVTENDQAVTVATGNFTTGAIKPGFWFTLTDSNGEPRGNWYRILSVTDASNLKLETYFEETGEAGATYLIGQVPEIPEEGHILLPIGALSEFYLLKQKDTETATRFNNIFWTGSPNVAPNFQKKDKDYGGLMGLIEAYRDRDSSCIVNRNPTIDYETYLEWGTTIS